MQFAGILGYNDSSKRTGSAMYTIQEIIHQAEYEIRRNAGVSAQTGAAMLEVLIEAAREIAVAQRKQTFAEGQLKALSTAVLTVDRNAREDIPGLEYAAEIAKKYGTRPAI